MEVPSSPEEQDRINQLASTTGQGAGQFVRDVMTGYLDEVRHTLTSRCDEIQNGQIQPVKGEEVFARLKRKSEERRAAHP